MLKFTFRIAAVAAVCGFLFGCGAGLFVTTARAQHNHAAGHSDYKDWASERTDNCCDDRDCGALEDGEWRESAAGTEVKIEGQWCPVLRQHWIKRGRSPDWNKAHACIQHRSGTMCDDGACYEDERNPCELLLCFSGKGGF